MEGSDFLVYTVQQTEVKSTHSHPEDCFMDLGCKLKINIGDTFTFFDGRMGQLITYTVENAGARFARHSLESLIGETSANKLIKIDVFTL